jgi:predicted nucleic acid-binding protein
LRRWAAQPFVQLQAKYRFITTSQASRMIIADTGFWLALSNPRDRYHGAACRALDALSESLITTWPVLTETCHLLIARMGAYAAEQLIASAVRGAFQIFALDATHLPRVVELMHKYRDLPMDLADASLVVLAEVLGDGRILSTDTRDFHAYRWKQRKPFQNLMTV